MRNIKWMLSVKYLEDSGGDNGFYNMVHSFNICIIWNEYIVKGLCGRIGANDW